MARIFLPSLPIILPFKSSLGIETTENLTDLVIKAREQGLIVLTAGSNVIRLLPPLTLTKEKIDEGVAILTDIFD